MTTDKNSPPPATPPPTGGLDVEANRTEALKKHAQYYGQMPNDDWEYIRSVLALDVGEPDLFTAHSGDPYNGPLTSDDVAEAEHWRRQGIKVRTWYSAPPSRPSYDELLAVIADLAKCNVDPFSLAELYVMLDRACEKHAAAIAIAQRMTARDKREG